MDHPPDPIKIAFGHPEGVLAAGWFRAYKALKRKMRRAGLNVQVELLPVTTLPSDLDFLVLATPLPGGIVTASQTIVCSPGQAQHELDDLVERLLSERRLQYAQRAARTFAVHRGFLPVTERARLEE